MKRAADAKAGVTGRDVEAVLLALSGKYPAAIQRLESLGKPPAEKSFVQNIAQSVKGGAADNIDVQLNTFIAIARHADAGGDGKSLALTLDHLVPYLGKRTGGGVRDNNQTQIDNATDYLSYAELAFDANRPGPDIDKAVAKAFDICNSVNQFPPDFLHQAVLFALKRDNYATALTLNENYDSEVDSAYLILTYFVRHNLWNEYDKFLARPGVIDKLSAAGEAPADASGPGGGEAMGPLREIRRRAERRPRQKRGPRRPRGAYLPARGRRHRRHF